VDDDVKYVVGGAALGAIIGALAAWSYRRYALQPALESGGAEVETAPVDRGKLMRLAWAVVAVVRQVLELG